MTSRTLAKVLDVVVAAKKPGAEMCLSICGAWQGGSFDHVFRS